MSNDPGSPLGARSTTIAGIVVDEDGAPAPGADVRVLMRSFVRADSNGRFEVEGLEPGEYEIVADWVGPWFAPRKNAAQQAVHAGDVDVRLVLPTGATVTGRAMLDGKPQTYFGLRLVGERESPSGRMPIGVRDEGGRFEVRHVHPGTWRIAIIAPGTRLVTSSEFTVTKDEAVDLGDIALTRGHGLSGHVRDHTGAPVAGARVCIGRMFSSSTDRSHLDRLFLGVYETRSDDAGAYSFDGIDVYRDPERVTEFIWAAHVAAGASVIQEVPKTDATMDFVLLGAGRIEGAVRNMRGGRGHLLAVRPDEPPWARHAHCDKEGRFAFEDLPPGDYVVKLNVPEIEQVQPATVTVIADQNVTATLVMNSTSVRLRVKVPAGRGKDLVIEPTSEGAGVGGRMRGIMRMGSEDTCSLEYVRPGGYRLSLDGEQWTSVTVEPFPQEQTIDLRPHVVVRSS